MNERKQANIDKKNIEETLKEHSAQLEGLNKHNLQKTDDDSSPPKNELLDVIGDLRNFVMDQQMVASVTATQNAKVAELKD